MITLWQDIRYGLRMLAKHPGFTLIAIVALTLGIASTTTIFTVLDAVLLQPLPYPAPDRIVTVAQTIRSTGISSEDSSPANYLDWVSQNNVFSELAAGSGRRPTLGGDHPERIRITITTSNFFDLFSVKPILGRTFTGENARPGQDHVAVLGYELWQSRFGGQPDILGRDLILDGERFTIIGVMPWRFSPDNYGQLWIPSRWDVPSHPLVPDQDPRPMRDRSYLDVWGRLKTGVTIEQARAQMKAIAARLEAQYPDANSDVGATVVPLREEVVSGLRPALTVLMGAVAFLLLIGCVNVANLLLVRAATRDREIAIRFALGASRMRLVRQLLTESVLLALFGGVLGVVFAAWAVPVLLAMGPADLRNFQDIGLNRQVLGFSLVVSVLTGVLFGSIPATYASFLKPNDSLVRSEHGTSRVHNRSRAFLITAEIALSLVLLIGAGLMMRSFANLTHVDPGFSSDHLLVFNVAAPSETDRSRQTIFYNQVVQRVAALPGVKVAGAVSRLPLSGGNSSRSYTVFGSEQSHQADLRVATSDYFRVMQIPLLRGRTFTDQDGPGSQPVVIINEALARTVFPNQEPIGKFILQGPESTQLKKLQIVGIVGNVHHVGLAKSPNPEIYRPIGQSSWPSLFVAVRSVRADPLTLVPAVQTAVWSVNKNVALANVRTMEDMVARSLANQKFTMLLLTIFAGIALVFAAIGLFGVMSYSVVQRAREIGLRMALGAQRSDIFKLIVREGMLLTFIGLVFGFGASWAMTRLISGFLFGVSATDLATFVVVSGLLALVALFACWWPAHRASSVDPIVALRTE